MQKIILQCGLTIIGCTWLMSSVLGQTDPCAIAGKNLLLPIIKSPQPLTTGAEILRLITKEQRVNQPFRNKLVKNILATIDTADRKVENFRSDETMLVIPLSNGRKISQHLKTDKDLFFLLLIEESTHKIRRMNLASFHFKNSRADTLPLNSFFRIFNSEHPSVDGTFTLINLDDVKEFEIDFCNNKTVAFRQWESKQEPNSETKKWYLHTTLYDEAATDDSFIQSNEVYLGSSNNKCPPGFLCD